MVNILDGPCLPCSVSHYFYWVSHHSISTVYTTKVYAQVVASLLTTWNNFLQEDDVRMHSHGLRQLVARSLLTNCNKSVKLTTCNKTVAFLAV